MPSGPNDRPARDDIEAVLGIGAEGAARARRRRTWLIVVALAVPAALGAIYWFAAAGRSGAIQYRTEPARRADITVIVTATGTVEPTNKVDVSSELSGIVRTVAVDYNSRVEVGQVLAELDTDKLAATVESSRAKVGAAKARIAEAEATVVEKQQELTRKLDLARESFISSQDVDTARASYDRALASLASARAELRAAEADLELNKTNLDKACICSPIDGIVLDRNVDPGQVVAASLQAPVLFTIAEDLTKMEVRVDVDEADVGKVREGQPATFTVDAYPDRKFRARIRAVRFGSEVVQGVVTYKAVLTTDNSDLLLRPGMTATAEITVQEEKDVLTVPNEALRFAPEVQNAGDDRNLVQMLLPRMPQFRPPSRPALTGPEREVWILRDGDPVPIKVTAGVTDGRRTQIDDGPLAVGDDVIVEALSPGS